MRHRADGLIFTLAIVICVWFPMQDLVLAALFGWGLPPTVAKAMILLKECLVALMIVGAVLRWTLGSPVRPCGVELCALFYLVLVSVYLPIGDAEIEPRLAQYRSLVLPVMLYLAGRTLPTSDGALERWIRWTLGLGLVLVVTGLIERFALDVQFWRSTVPIGAYLESVKSQQAHLVDGLPGNLYGDYSFGYFQFRRLCGVFGSPLTMGYYLVFPIVLGVTILLGGPPRRSVRWWIVAGLALSCVTLLLTVTRAGVGAVLIAVALGILVYRHAGLLVAATIFGAGLFLIFQDTLLRIAQATWEMNDSSMRAHALFLQESVDVVTRYPTGLGVGLAGGWAHTMSERFSGAAENAFLVIVAQASVYAGLLFVVFVVAALWRIVCASFRFEGGTRKAFGGAVVLSGVGYMATGLLSEQILTFTSVAHFWMSLGYAVSLTDSNTGQESP